MQTIHLKNGINLHIVQSKKYKEIATYYNYYRRITQSNRVIRALVSYMLADNSLAYPTKSSMTRAKDMLFGATINASNYLLADANIIQVSTKVLNDQYSDKDNLYQALKLLKEIIEKPLMNEENLKEAKRNLKDSSKRKIDKPVSFATSRAYELFGESTYLEYAKIIEPDKIDEISLEMVINEYNSMMNDPLDIFVFGKIDVDVFKNQLLELFTFSNREDHHHSPHIITDKAYKRIQEYKDVDQCTIVMIYETSIPNGSDDYYKLKAANSMLGQTPTSLLFQEVREKNSLCYSIGSSILSDEGLLIIKTGVDKNNEDKAIELINKQVERIKSGDFDEQTLKEALNLYCNMLKGSIDDRSVTLNFKYNSVLNKNMIDIEDTISLYNTFTKEDIIDVFSKVELKFVYSLKRGNDDETN